MNYEQEIRRLLNRSWSEFAELYGAVRAVIGYEIWFDCFEEWRPGEVVIRYAPIGHKSDSFSFRIHLQQQELAA